VRTLVNPTLVDDYFEQSEQSNKTGLVSKEYRSQFKVREGLDESDTLRTARTWGWVL